MHDVADDKLVMELNTRFGMGYSFDMAVILVKNLYGVPKERVMKAYADRANSRDK